MEDITLNATFSWRRKRMLGAESQLWRVTRKGSENKGQMGTQTAAQAFSTVKADLTAGREAPSQRETSLQV